ncbi:MAG: glycosyltransferase [Lachnospira sp.]|nr:glycosyltransferase [Lachnospira sp.]
MKRILMFKTSMCCEDSVVGGLVQLEFHVDVLTGSVRDYERDSEIQKGFLSYFQQCYVNGITCDAVFSIDYYPVISRICMTMQIPYISWIVDCPLNTLFSKTVINDVNWIFTFDRNQQEWLKSMGVKHSYHMALATDIHQWDSIQFEENDYPVYSSDVSFLGNLYNDQKSNHYLAVQTVSPYLHGFYEGVMEAQLGIYGASIIGEALTKTVVDESKGFIQFDLGMDYYENYHTLLADMLYTEVSHRERIQILSMLGKSFLLKLYTSSDCSELCGIPIEYGGYVDYLTQMPKVFSLSKININITSKSIKTGIPLRVLDILGAGGFLITNYQSEIAELFTDGKELVMYESMEDLKEKVSYYLEHEEERKRIAAAGYERVKQEFSYEKKLAEIMGVVFGHDGIDNERKWEA